MSNPKLRDYIKIARFGRWSMNLLLVPGVVIASVYSHQLHQLFNLAVLAAFLALCCASFANYTINEFLDAKFDALHPEKKNRPAAQGLLQRKYVLCEYFIFVAAATVFSLLVNHLFVILVYVFLLMGVFYNVEPIRTKDKPILDILSESINNPLRFSCGWVVIPQMVDPPWAILLTCWMSAAFVLTMKRYAEMRHLDNSNILVLYRRSFYYYTDKKLFYLAFFFASLACISLAIFLWGYKPLSLLTLPLFAGLFVWYARIGSLPNSPVQHPEQLYHCQPLFMGSAFLVSLLTLTLFFLH